MNYDVQLNLKTESKRRMLFKHSAEIGGSNITNVVNDFMQLFIDLKLKPEDVKKLTISRK